MAGMDTPVVSAPVAWSVAGATLDLSRPLIMGVVNVTPDSFSDGGRFLSFADARAHALRLVDEGADLLDIGGESTRPGAADVSEDEETQRVIPLIETLRGCGIPISIETSKAAVMRAALAAGAAIVNDVRALQEPGAVEAVAATDCGIVVMHMQGTPRTMQREPRYDDVVREVSTFLQERVVALGRAGIAAARIVVDPGFGFGKSVVHNYTLLHDLRALTQIGRPLLVGISRKAMLGAATGRQVGERAAASIAAAVLAVERGARIVRVHDVAGTRDAIRVWAAMTRKGDG
jgi:dihydropteroate synthase